MKTPNLKSFWRFEGNALDAVGGNNLTVTGAANGAGRIGNGYVFDGIDDKLKVSDPADGSLDPGTGEMTISFWFNKTTQVAQNVRVIYKGATDDSADEQGWHVRLSDTQAQFSVNDDTAATRSTVGASGLSVGTWYHCAATRSGATHRIYINGVVNEITDGLTGNISGTKHFVVGSADTQLFMKGSIDEVGFWKKALTVEDVKRVMHGFNPLVSG